MIWYRSADTSSESISADKISTEKKSSAEKDISVDKIFRGFHGFLFCISADRFLALLSAEIYSDKAFLMVLMITFFQKPFNCFLASLYTKFEYFRVAMIKPVNIME